MGAERLPAGDKGLLGGRGECVVGGEEGVGRRRNERPAQRHGCVVGPASGKGSLVTLSSNSGQGFCP